MTKRIKEKIEELYNKYTLHLESPRVSDKKYKLFFVTEYEEQAAKPFLL